MPPLRQGNRIRTYGLMTGVALLVFFAALITLSALRSTTREELGIIEDIPVLGQTGSGLTIQLTDRDTGRLTGEIRSDRVEPLPDSRSRVEQPVAFIFLDEQRTLHVRADEGEFFIPDQGAGPESGVLSGDVMIRMFETPAPLRMGTQRPGFTPHYPDLDTDLPAVTFVTDTPLNFDLRVLTAETEGRIHAWGEAFELVGHGLDVVLNERRERIERITIQRGEYLFLREQDDPDQTPIVASVNAQPASSSSTGVSQGGAAPNANPARDPVATADPPAGSTPTINAYTISAAEKIRVQLDDGVLTGEYMTAWLRLENNRLPEGAFGPESDPESEPTPVSASSIPPTTLAMAPAVAIVPVHLAQPLDHSQQTTFDPAEPEKEIDSTVETRTNGRLGTLLTQTETEPASETSRSVLMTWTGPLRVTPVDPDIRELRRDDLAVLITEPGGLVKAHDNATGVSAQAPQIRYAATTRVLTMDSGESGNDAPDSASRDAPIDRDTVRIADALGRELLTSRLRADLLAKEVSILAGGSLLDATQTDTSIEWHEAGALRFRTADALVNGQMTSRDELEHAWFAGRAIARSDGSQYSGDRLEFDFYPSAEPSSASSPSSSSDTSDSQITDTTLRLKATRAYGRAHASDPGSQSISASELHITFADDISHSAPATLTADGSVHVGDDDIDLLGEHLHAVFASPLTSDDDEIRIASATIDERVEFTRRSDAIVAFADQIQIGAGGTHATLIGTKRPAQMAQQATRITGSRIELSDVDGTAVVHGAGTIEHVEPPTSPTTPPTSVRVSWTEQLRFDDRRGIADCIGNAVAVSTTGTASKDTLRADRVLLSFTPSDPEFAPGGLAHLLPPGIAISTPPGAMLSGPTASVDTTGDSDPVRDLLQVVSLGTPQRPATIERRQFMPSARTHVRSDMHASPEATSEMQQRVRRIEYIDGTTIIADQSRGLFEVPGPGRLLLLDRESNSEPEDSTADNTSDDPMGQGDTGSVTRLSWLDGFLYDQTRSTATATGSARITQQDMVTRDAIDIRADSVVALLDPAETDAAQRTASDSPELGGLRHAEASGNVRVTSISERGSTPEATGALFADAVLFDPARDLIEAVAAANSEVLFRAPDRPEPLRARRLLWNPTTGRIDVVGPRPLSIGTEASGS